MKATLLLADHAQVADGKLYISGGGWNVTGPPTPFAIALLLEIPEADLGEEHNFAFQLYQGRDQVSQVISPDGLPIKIEGDFQADRDFEADSEEETLVTLPLAMNLPPLPLIPRQKYKWVLTIDGEENENWVINFETREFDISISESNLDSSNLDEALGQDFNGPMN